MVVLGLLVVGLLCLVLGLVLPSTAWLIASLIASVGAGYVLYRSRRLVAGAGAHTAEASASAAPEREAADAQPGLRARRRTRAEERAARNATTPAAFTATDSATDTAPDTGGGTAADTTTGTAADTIGELEHPADSADLHDTTVIAPVLDPVADDPRFDEPAGAVAGDERAGVSAAELLAGMTVEHARVEDPSAAGSDGDVWVIDGRPRYHLATCAIIQGQDAEPIPFEQATEDGFMPCSLCEPNIVRATAS